MVVMLFIGTFDMNDVQSTILLRHWNITKLKMWLIVNVIDNVNDNAMISLVAILCISVMLSILTYFVLFLPFNFFCISATIIYYYLLLK